MTYDEFVTTARTLMTVAEFERLPDDGNRHELDEGELIVMPPPGFRHGLTQRAVAVALDQAARKSRAGMVVTECGFRLAPGIVQAPDVAFVRNERQDRIPAEGYCEFGPDLVVEILSPDDNAARLQRKIGWYLAAGTRIVWVLDPDTRSLSVYEQSGVFRTLNAHETIDAPDLLPGFSAEIETLFE